jgi:hypothetical protein
MGTKRKSQKKEKKRTKIKQKLFAKLPTEDKKIVDENWEGLGAWIHLGLQRRKHICCFCLVYLFVFVLLREEAWRRRTTTTTTTRRRAFEVASLQRKEFQQSFFVFP